MKTIDIVFDGPPAQKSGRFVEVEDSEGKGINFGEWIHRDDGYWALRITDSRELQASGHSTGTISKYDVMDPTAFRGSAHLNIKWVEGRAVISQGKDEKVLGIVPQLDWNLFWEFLEGQGLIRD